MYTRKIYWKIHTCEKKVKNSLDAEAFLKKLKFVDDREVLVESKRWFIFKLNFGSESPLG